MWREPALYTSLGAVAPCVYLCSWTALLRPSQTCGCRVDPFPARVKIRPTHEQTGASSGSCAQVGMVHAYRPGSGQVDCISFSRIAPLVAPWTPPRLPSSGHQPDSGLPWGTLGSPSGSVLAARA